MRRSPSSGSIGIGPRGHKVIQQSMVRFIASAVLVTVLTLSAGAPSAEGVSLRTDTVDGVPVSQLESIRAATPDVGLRSGVLVDGEGRILWARKPDDERAMASITKVMTAVVALESASLNDMVEVPAAATRVGESTSFLRTGDELSIQDMLKALLVKSGNDAAVALAIHVSGSPEAFVAAMNKKAAELGLDDTHFANVHGLDANDHHSSSRDLGVLARYAMSKPAFKSIVGMKEVTIGLGGRQETLPATNILLGHYQGITGIKTGYTKKAGYCVIESAERSGVTLYAVVLGTATENARFRDARELLDWGFAHYRPQSLASSGTVLAEAPVSDYLDVVVPAAVSQSAVMPVLDLNGPIKRSVSISAVSAPVDAGQRVGVAKFTQGGRLIASIPLVSTVDVRKPNIALRLWIAMVRAWRAVF